MTGVYVGGALIVAILLGLGALALANQVRRSTRFEDARACRLFGLATASKGEEVKEGPGASEARRELVLIARGAFASSAEIEQLPGGMKEKKA